MSLPSRVAESLARFGVPADTVARLDDLFGLLGPGVVDVLGEHVDAEGLDPSTLHPQDLDFVRARLGRRYLEENHGRWCEGEPTPAFWRDRSMQSGASGIAIPLGDLEQAGTTVVDAMAAPARAALGSTQPPPRGLLLLTRNAHLGNQRGGFSVDLVPSGLEHALAVNAAEGRHHTLPGAIGQASGRLFEDVALLWEVQPNLYKPGGGRNQEAGAAWRRYRSWPLLTAMGALAWLAERSYRTYLLDGSALKATHEVDPAKPLGDEIAALHDRTFQAAAGALGLRVEPLGPADDAELLATLGKVNLAREVETRGAAALFRAIRR